MDSTFPAGVDSRSPVIPDLIASGLFPSAGDAEQELKKARIRHDILAREVRRLRMLEEEVRRELELERMLIMKLQGEQRLGLRPVDIPLQPMVVPGCLTAYPSEVRGVEDVQVREPYMDSVQPMVELGCFNVYPPEARVRELQVREPYMESVEEVRLREMHPKPDMAERLREVQILGLLPPTAAVQAFCPPEAGVAERPGPVEAMVKEEMPVTSIEDPKIGENRMLQEEARRELELERMKVREEQSLGLRHMNVPTQSIFVPGFFSAYPTEARVVEEITVRETYMDTYLEMEEQYSSGRNSKEGDSEGDSPFLSGFMSEASLSSFEIDSDNDEQQGCRTDIDIGEQHSSGRITKDSNSGADIPKIVKNEEHPTRNDVIPNALNYRDRPSSEMDLPHEVSTQLSGGNIQNGRRKLHLSAECHITKQARSDAAPHRTSSDCHILQEDASSPRPRSSNSRYHKSRERRHRHANTGKLNYNFDSNNHKSCGKRHRHVDCTQSYTFKNNCFRCGQKGHRIADCPFTRDVKSNTSYVHHDKCYGCGERGHHIADCLVACRSDARHANKNQKLHAKDYANTNPFHCYQCGRKGHRKFECHFTKD